MDNMLTPEKSIILKNKLDTINDKLNKLLELHNELKYILNESIIINEQILEEELFLDIENDINETQLEINSIANSITNNF